MHANIAEFNHKTCKTFTAEKNEERQNIQMIFSINVLVDFKVRLNLGLTSISDHFATFCCVPNLYRKDEYCLERLI